MPTVQFGPIPFDADLVAFDKDGTLLEFESMWGRLAEAWAAALAISVQEPAVEDDLHRIWGYDTHSQRTLPQSPLAVASTGQLQVISAAVLYRYGTPWNRAIEQTRAIVHPRGVEISLAEITHPAGQVCRVLEQLQKANIRVAVVTADDRSETEEAIEILGISHLVDHTACEDDGLPGKPAPDMLLATCKRLGIAPARTAVVGDTVTDLLMAQRAGAGLRVAVLTGADEEALLAAHADVVLSSIDDITLPRS